MVSNRASSGLTWLAAVGPGRELGSDFAAVWPGREPGYDFENFTSHRAVIPTGTWFPSVKTSRY